ncbi:MAG: hypothetical protein AB1742_14375, partial [bacterium]
LVSRAPRGSEGGDDSPQSKACLPAGRRLNPQSIVTKNVRKFTLSEALKEESKMMNIQCRSKILSFLSAVIGVKF